MEIDDDPQSNHTAPGATEETLSRRDRERLQKRIVTRTPKFLRVTQENVAKHRSVQVTYIDRFLSEQEPVVGSPETVLTQEERAHIHDNTALNHFTLQMSVLHHQINTEHLPQGAAMQRLFFQIAARPPFATNGLEKSPMANQLSSLAALANVMLNTFALHASGLLRLRTGLYLLVLEWRTENSCHLCVALVLTVPSYVKDPWMPDTDTISYRNVPSGFASIPTFQYNGYVYADSCISGAAAGAPSQ